MDESSYWLAFSVFPGVGPKRFKDLLDYFTSAENAWNADKNDLEKVIGKAFAEKLIIFRQSFDLEKYHFKLKEKKVFYLTLNDEEYPPLLKQIKDPPFVLYVKGELDFNSPDNQKTVGIVGTRKVTTYGRQVTEMLTSDLVNAGCVIVSGLALGVDAVAHQTTLENNGRTIAVLGCGVDCCNPTSNQKIYQQIIDKGGAVVSEFSLTQSPSIGSFPSRNRIIAGLSQAVLVTEGASDSGALITAEDAFANGRKVFAVPGPITSSLSHGPNSLLSKGGKLVTSSRDILEEIGLKDFKKVKLAKKILAESKEEQQIIDLLEAEALLFDQIVNKTKSNAQVLGVLLSMMEVKGYISRDGDKYNLA